MITTFFFFGINFFPLLSMFPCDFREGTVPSGDLVVFREDNSAMIKSSDSLLCCDSLRYDGLSTVSLNISVISLFPA